MSELLVPDPGPGVVVVVVEVVVDDDVLVVVDGGVVVEVVVDDVLVGGAVVGAALDGGLVVDGAVASGATGAAWSQGVVDVRPAALAGVGVASATAIPVTPDAITRIAPAMLRRTAGSGAG